MGLISGSGISLEVGNGNPLQYSCLENPWTEEPGGLQSMESQKVGHDLAAKQQQQCMCVQILFRIPWLQQSPTILFYHED